MYLMGEESPHEHDYDGALHRSSDIAYALAVAEGRSVVITDLVYNRRSQQWGFGYEFVKEAGELWVYTLADL